MRRAALCVFLFAVLGILCPAQVHLNQALTNRESSFAELSDMDSDIEAFMQFHSIVGMGVSVFRNDSLLFSQGYGWADRQTRVKMAPGTLMRVASVSKLFTATGIMVLRDRGLLSLSDKVFGPQGILNDADFTAAVRDKAIFDITVEHLLRHQAGFGYRSADPMFSTVQMMNRYGLRKAPDAHTLVRCQLGEPLYFPPGTTQRYSNLGYLILSLVIEKLSGCGYEEWMIRNVFEPAGCYDMHIAYNYYNQRLMGESRYYAPPGTKNVPEYNKSGRWVERMYGGNDIRGLQGAGGWVCSTPELARFVASIDGRGQVSDIVSAESFEEMVRYFDKDTFSLGWVDTNPEQGWTRTGSLCGTSALVRYFPDGECWIIVTNTSSYMGYHFSSKLKELVNSLRDNYDYLLPNRDLF